MTARCMSFVFKRLKELTELRTAVLFLHHSRKQSFFNRGNLGETMRGSSDILAAIDSHLLLEKTESGIKITQTKLRQAEPVNTFSVKVVSGEELFDFEYIGEVEDSLGKVTKSREEIVEFLKDSEQGRQEIIEALKGTCGSSTVDKALKGLLAEKIISRKAGTNNKHTYYLEDNESQEKLV